MIHYSNYFDEPLLEHTGTAWAKLDLKIDEHINLFQNNLQYNSRIFSLLFYNVSS